MLIAVVAGQPVMATSNLAVVLVKVTVAAPLQVASGPVVAGASFEDLSSALNTFATVGAGVGVGEAVGEAVGVGVDTAAVPPQAAIRIAVAAMPANTRIFDPPCGFILYTAGRAVRMTRPSRPISTDSVEDGHPSRAEVTLRL